MSAAHDLPFYIVTETGEVWVTNDSGNGTVSTYYGKHDVVVQELHTRVAYLEQENARLTSEIIRVEGGLAALLSPNAGKE